MPVKIVDLKIENIKGITTSTKVDDNGELIGAIRVEAIVNPIIIARLLNLQRQRVPLFITIGTDQIAMDLQIATINPITGEFEADK